MSEIRQFQSPAQPYVQLWRTLLGIILVHVAFFAATFAIITAGGRALGVHPARIVSANTPEHAALFFLTFLGYHIGLWLVVRILHKRDFGSLLGPLRRLIPRHFFIGLGIALLMAASSFIFESVLAPILPYEGSAAMEQARDASLWLKWVPIAVVLVFVQIFAEELVFRGYILQQLRARFNTIWLWAILPSVLFGILHFDPATYGVNAYFYVLHTTVVGIVLAIVTLRTGNLGAAVGLHFGNNISLVLAGNSGTLEGFSLFLAETNPMSPYMGQAIFMQTCIVILLFAGWWGLTQRKGLFANQHDYD